MYARIVTYTLQTEKRGDFNRILRDQVLPILKREPGFVDLVGLVSDEQPDHALAIALWKSREDASHLYIQSEPMLDLLMPPLTHPPTVQHCNVQTSIFQYASKAT
jgi:quinol monooxygenase YgiN